MPLLIKNGEIITADSRYFADIYIEDETITEIGHNIKIAKNTEVIDASGKYVFPGFIDPHVHVYLPAMGMLAKDNHQTASQAALVGGTTTYIEMVAPSRDDDYLEAYNLWKAKAEGNSACDYSFHMGVSKFEKDTEEQLRQIVADGTTSFKILLAYKDVLDISDEELYKVLTLAKDLDIITTAHCENAELIAQLQNKFISEGKSGPEWHEASRPVSVEEMGTNKFLGFLENTGAKGYIVHLSNERALKAALRAKKRAVDVKIETVIPHLFLDKSYAEKANFEGAKYIMSPPLREKHNQIALLRALSQGMIDTVATDHAPFDFVGQKDKGRQAFTKIPSGIPSIENRITLLYTYAVRRGNLDINDFVAVAASNAAKIFGLFPKKGTIAVGSDADLVIFDPNSKDVLTAEKQLMNVDYCAFEGTEIDGKPDIVTVRGQVAVRNGSFVGDPKRGKFLPRKNNS